MNVEFTLSLIQLISVVLFLAALFVGIRILLPNSSYQINKPYQWIKAKEDGLISSALSKEEFLYADKVRFYTFWLQLERIKRENIAGSMAELGVYQGMTARTMSLVVPDKRLHLFDTFEGFDTRDIQKGEMNNVNAIPFMDTNIEKVKEYIGTSKNSIFHKGYFPDTTIELAEEEYAFVHIDVDLYRPTLEGLKYFYPRLSSGGVIIVHDYNNNWEGVKKAVDEFSSQHQSSIVEVADMQGSILIFAAKGHSHRE